MHIISVSDFSLWMNTEGRGVADSRSAKTTGVYRLFLGYTWHARGELFSPCKLTKNQDPRSYEPPSAVSMHPFQSQADKIRRDRRAPESATAEEIRRRSTCDIERQEPRSRVPTDKGGDCTTKGASHGEPADDRVRLSEE